MESKLDVRIYETRKSMGAAAAEKFAKEVNELLKTKDEINIIFAAAPSQNEFLESLDDENLDWSRINAFHMDEYIGLSASATQGFGNFLRHRLFDRFNFKSVHYLDGNAANIEEECKRYSHLLDRYAVDIVCMGIGENGHLAFNDPPVANFTDANAVKVVKLDEVCRKQQVNDGCFVTLNEVPKMALTLTIPALLRANYIGCVVPGPTKAQAVAHTLHHEISTAHPSTILRTHSNAVLFLDRDSSKLLMD
jgi:glucosamine-6-phosphate deaminase